MTDKARHFEPGLIQSVNDSRAGTRAHAISSGGAATALPGDLEWITRANLALAEAILEPSPARFQALETAAVALERAGLVDEAQAMRRNRERLAGRN